MSGGLPELEQELIQKAQDKLHQRIEAGEFNGDVQENILLVLLSVNRRLGRIAANPMIRLGDFFLKYPKTAWVAAMTAWVLVGAGSLLAIVTFLNAIGVHIYLQP